MRARLFACTLLCIVHHVGCDSSNGSQRVPDQPVEPRATAPQPSASASKPQYADEDLPVAADFEVEADNQITDDNYVAELEAIEQAMGIDAGTPDATAPKPDAGPKPTPTAAGKSPAAKGPKPAPKGSKPAPKAPKPAPKAPKAPSDDAYD